MRPWVLFLLLAGCPKPPTAEAPIDWGITPHLPAPFSGTYQRAPTTPEDPVIARIVRQKRWDEALAGGAARLALSAVEGDGGLARWEIREAGWLAGYPYPVRRAKGWSTLVNSPPPDDLFEFVAGVGADEDLGLVRARSPGGDAWVALVAAPRVDLPPQQRSRPLGSILSLPALDGVRYEVADANGRLSKGLTPATFTLGVAGEWLVRLDDAEGLVAQFPLYVGLDAPKEPLFSRPASTVSDAESARERSLELLGEIRRSYGLTPWQDDLILEAAAQQALRGSLDDPALAVWKCRASTVEDCVDAWVWSVDKRATLLSDKMHYAGMAATWDAQGLQLAAVMAIE